VTTENCGRSHAALDRRLTWVVIPENGTNKATNTGNAGHKAGSHKYRRTRRGRHLLRKVGSVVGLITGQYRTIVSTKESDSSKLNMAK
jgi:hypothetical protein